MIETNTAEGVEECEETVRGTSTHVEVMRRMRYEPSLPVTKKTKTNWDMLVDEFPCPVDIQHSVWAARILRNFKKDLWLSAWIGYATALNALLALISNNQRCPNISNTLAIVVVRTPWMRTRC